MSLSTTELHWRIHNGRLQSNGKRAEADYPEGRIGQVIAQLRRRGLIATRRANWLLVFLIIVILFGLGYYLGLPLLQRSLDGTRQTLEDTRAAIATSIAELNTNRDGIHDTLAAAPALQYTATSVDSGTGLFLEGHMVLDTGILIYADDGTILFSEDEGETFATLPSVEEWFPQGHVLLETNFLIYGENGTILQPSGNGPTLERVDTGTSAHFIGHIALDDSLLVYSETGDILRSTDDGRTFEPQEPGTDPNDRGWFFRDHVVLDDSVLIYDGGGGLHRSTDGGQTFEFIPTAEFADINGHIPMGDSVIFYGWDGLLRRYNDSDQTFEDVQSDTRSFGLQGHVVLDDAILIYGDFGTVLRSTDGGDSFETLDIEIDPEPFFQGHLIQGETILIYGDFGSIVRSTDGGRSFRAIDSPTDWYLGDHAVHENSILIYGDSGTILRSDDNGESFRLVATGTDASMWKHVELDHHTLVYGSNGTILRLSDEWLQAISELELVIGEAGDTTLLSNLDALPAHVAADPDIAGLRLDLLSVIAQRSVLDERLSTVTSDIDAFNNPLEWLLFQRSQQREDFAAFMAICRTEAGTVASTGEADAITLACTEAYRQQLASDEQNFWEILAQQVPPGLLILFLLVTLGGLYRYNMRLAGFHHSRADLLELWSIGRNPSDAIRGEEWAQLVQGAEALGADKVEFGTTKAGVGPSGAQFELSRALKRE